MARIGIAALGTQGDVLPFIELGRGLRATGHDVVLSTTERFASLAAASGLESHRLPGDPSQMFEAVGFDPRRISPWRIHAHIRLIHSALDALVGQTSDADLLAPWTGIEFAVFSPTTTFARAAAEHLGVPAAMMALTPSVATGAFAHPVLTPFLKLGPVGNRATWLVGERLQRQTYTEPLRPNVRRTWSLPALPLAATSRATRWPPFPVAHAFSSTVVPRPADWPGHVDVTGWILPEPSSAPLAPEVETFLTERAEPPIYIGFGSMPIADPDATAQIVLSALSRTGLRAIISGDGLIRASALEHNPAVLTVAQVPHEQLFPRVAAVVHHGGSGTVGTGLRAGRPTLVVPIVFDQFFWGKRVAAIGAGPEPLPFNRLSADRLSAALRAFGSPLVRAGAERAGERITAEDGLGRAVAAVEEVL